MAAGGRCLSGSRPKLISYGDMHSFKDKAAPSLTSSPSMNEGDSLVAINVLIAEHCMLCYPTCSRSVSRRAVARTGNRCAALNVPARNREPWQGLNIGALPW